MLKKDITYFNLDDESITETFYFNLTKFELTKLEMSIPGGLSGFIDNLKNTRSFNGIVKVLEIIFGTAVGERSENGKFVKSKEITDSFLASEAWSKMFDELFENPRSIVDTFVAMMPAEARGDIQKKIAELQESSEVLDGMDAAQIVEIAKNQPKHSAEG